MIEYGTAKTPANELKSLTFLRSYKNTAYLGIDKAESLSEANKQGRNEANQLYIALMTA